VRRPQVKTGPIRKVIEATLAGEKRAGAEVSVIVVGDSRIRKLNRQYRGIDSPTDVLAFAMGEGDFTELNPELLGDVVISADTAEKQAAKAGHDLMEEILMLAAHGTLHLLGYEDETSSGRARMRRRAKKYLKSEGNSGGKGP
jgi:probable rRNA maturation factor